MKKLNKLFAFVILCSFAGMVNAQEVITNMNTNPVLQKKTAEIKIKTKSVESINLPFFDDFTYKDVFPSQLYWQDKNAYINNDYAYHPVSYGVATLDALDENGKVHSNLYPGVKEVADYLTSQPIRLDSIFGTENRLLHDYDSVYFSFFYQPNYWDEALLGSQGLKGDSLVVEFYSPADEEWYHVWSTERFPFDSIKPEENNGRTFIEVIIPIVDEDRYFHDGFQFRFKNYVTLTEGNYYPGWQVNGSQWNIDYVYLDRDRRFNAYYKDICFVNNAGSFLKNYSSMPYNQYSVSLFTALDEMRDSVPILISNLDKTANNVGYDYIVTKSNGEIIDHQVGGSGVIYPFHTSGYYQNGEYMQPVLDGAKYFPLSTSADSAEFTITHYLTSDLDFKQNDTISFVQKFHNYYAYDNGSSEYSYTLKTTGNAELAVLFKINSADTLRAVKIYFNDIAGAASEFYYNLRIWNRQDLKPHTIIHEQEIVVKNDNPENDDFITIMLDKPIVINQENFPNMVFYVGLEKPSTEKMALGFDISKDNSSNTYYNVTGQWERSIFSGTVMIRPVLGKKFELASIEYHEDKEKIIVYPNPVKNGQINIRSEVEIKSIYIYNGFGVKVYESNNEFTYNKSVSMSNLRQGIYLVVVVDNRGLKYTEKIILMH
ncbi:T9SS type A sorting domain-containing protein [Bacteroidales bacterium OttesenSCG-928-K03]|nr:T9SS type A sorting domain-containing protein [Odoribacter sp. OttesenSCG-928-L07]MDL2239527.1 T9SS type A sorting domain-containing protein [Bacteroidales bacterium OttesenSCG-928-L14]MDL2242210.1 T9SS type A sorting domain-containing protein [Bacteroidales bacterium OttesenSCG-928-K03]